jgi:hypothetical protein
MNPSNLGLALDLLISLENDNEAPLDTVAYIIRSHTRVEIEFVLDSFVSAGRSNVPSFLDVVKSVGYFSEEVTDNMNIYSNWFTNLDFTDENYVAIEESAGQLSRISKDSNDAKKDKIQYSKFETFVSSLSRIGYSPKDLILEIGESSKSWILPYVRVNLDKHDVSVYFNLAYQNATYVVSDGFELNESLKSELTESKINFIENKPYLFWYHFLKFVDPEKIEVLRDSFCENLKVNFSSQDFMKLTIDDLGELIDCDLNWIEFARYVLGMNFGAVFSKVEHFELAKRIWPEDDLRTLDEMTEGEVVDLFRDMFPEFLDCYSLKSKERATVIYNGYSLQNFAYRLGIVGRVIDKKPYWEFLDFIYGVDEESFKELGRQEYLDKFKNKEDFVSTKLKDIKFNLFNGKKGVISFVNYIFEAKYAYFNKEIRAQLADWIWEN